MGESSGNGCGTPQGEFIVTHTFVFTDVILVKCGWEIFPYFSTILLFLSLSLPPLSVCELKLLLFPPYRIKYRVPESSKRVFRWLFFSFTHTFFILREEKLSFSLTLSFSFYLFGGADFPLAGHSSTNRERFAFILVHTWLHYLSLQCVSWSCGATGQISVQRDEKEACYCLVD